VDEQQQQKDDLHATAEQLARDATELSRIEQAKTNEDPTTGRFRWLTERAEGMVQRIARLMRVQRELADEVADSGPDGAGPVT
jgi:hypothetical protein